MVKIGTALVLAGLMGIGLAAQVKTDDKGGPHTVYLIGKPDDISLVYDRWCYLMDDMHETRCISTAELIDYIVVKGDKE